ncbi:MAG: ABC transporter permease [Thaumarchaeota archaeon]|nr:ABC transporter permease [Nitrososphaerota archaeon]
MTEQASEGNILPTSLTQVGIITRYEILNYFRSRRFLILLVIDLLISGLLTFLVAYYGINRFAGSPPQPIAFYAFYWTAVTTLIVVFCAVFFGGDAISGEFQNKTGYFLVGNPIRRSSIYIGKWFASLTASLIIIGIFTAILLGNGLYYFGANVPMEFSEAFIFTIVYLVAALGFTFFFSSLFKSSSFSILVTVILLLFGFSFINLLVTNLVNIEPWFILTYGSGIISSVFTVPYPPHLATLGDRFGGGGGGPVLNVFTATIPEGLAIMLIYFAITAVLGLLLFERKEFN